MLKVDMIGMEAMTRRIQSASREMQARISDEVNTAGLKFIEGAKRDLVSQSSDTGGLLNSIIVKPVDLFNVDVTAEKFYAAFLEFGTKGHYRPIPGTEDIAAQMKGYKRNFIRNRKVAMHHNVPIICVRWGVTPPQLN